MFDTIVHRHEEGPRYPQTINLAPTAEHMRLLEEFRVEAQRKVEAAVQVPTITLGQITAYQAVEGTRVLFCINGHMHRVTIDDTALILEPVAWTLAESITRRIFDAIVTRNRPSPQEPQ